MNDNKKNGTALAVRDVGTAVASMADVVSQNGMWEKICAMGKVLRESGFLGEKVTDAGATAAAMTMVSEGLNPVEFRRRYHIIGNTPSRTTGSLLGDFQAMGGTWEIVCADDAECTIDFALGKQKYRSSITMKRMLQTTVPFGSSGQLKSNWANFPDDMLWARCVSKGLRRVAPSLMGGIYAKEEVMDFGDRADAAPRADISENELRYRAAMQKGPVAPEAKVEVVPDLVEVDAKPGKVYDDVDKADDADVVGMNASTSEPASPEFCCPVEGPYFGVPFSGIGADILQFLLMPNALAKHPEMTPAHIAAATAALNAMLSYVKEADYAE